MPAPFVTAQGIVSRKKPAPNSSDNQRDGVPFRSGRYGEEYNLSLIPKNHLLADEGSFFIATNPTPGTGVASHATPDATHSLPSIGGNVDLAPYFVLYNSASATDGTRVYIDSMQLVVTATGAGGTSINMAWQTDIWAARQKVGAAVLGSSITPVNPNMDDGSKSVVQMWAGANVITGSAGAAGAPSITRLFPQRQFRPVIPVVGDVYALTFGGAEQFVGSLISTGTAICQQSFNYPPVIIGPGQCALGFLWEPSGTTLTLEFDLSWWER